MKRSEKAVTATKRELDILRMINEHIKKFGFPPTRAEISRYFEFKSNNAANDFVKALAKKEYINLYTEVSRGIKILPKGIEAIKCK